MIWQDIAISISQWVLLINLLPTLFSRELPPYLTSVPTGIILIFMGICFLTLSLWCSFLSSASVGAAWLLIALKKWYLKL